MRRLLFPRAAACLWGVVVFMPVGMNHLAFVLLFLALLVAGDWRARLERLRSSPLWWPLVAFVLWQLAVLALGRHYAETGVNLWHGLRIALTISLALVLTRDEAIWAIRGFMAAALFNIAYLAVFYTVLLKFGVMPPMPNLLQSMIMLVGNKSINNALLFTVLGAGAAAYALHWLSTGHPYRALTALCLTGVTLLIINTNLQSRTSLLALLLVLPALCIHQWRRRWHTLVFMLLAGAAVLAVAVWSAPPFIEQKLAQGVQEIEAAKHGTVSEGSWVVRYYMYTETGRMVLDKPLAGWGIGAWNQLWRERGPALLADYNMPHNDFLWMGSQTGLPGLLALLVLMLAGLWQAWKRPDLTGRLAFAALFILLFASSVNSAWRDAQIGLSLPWVALVLLRLAGEPDTPPEPIAELPPRRWQAALD